MEKIPGIKESHLWPLIQQYGDWEYFYYGKNKAGRDCVGFRALSDSSMIVTFETTN